MLGIRSRLNQRSRAASRLASTRSRTMLVSMRRYWPGAEAPASLPAEDALRRREGYPDVAVGLPRPAGDGARTVSGGGWAGGCPDRAGALRRSMPAQCRD